MTKKSEKKDKIALGKREIRMFLMLGFIGAMCLFYVKLYKPKIRKIRSLERKEKDLELKAENIRNESPNLVLMKKEINDLMIKLANHKSQLKELESNIPRSSALDRFLHFLTSKQYTEGIAFQSIKPIVEKGSLRGGSATRV